MKKISVVTVLLFSFFIAPAQIDFREQEHPMTFIEMQRQFAEWKKGKDLTKIKGWKYFKRWEDDMQKHTDAQGVPVDPQIYYDALTAALKEKEVQERSSSAVVTWLPTGPFDLPTNLTGYMEVGMGRVNCMAFHPSDPATYYVGVAQGGMWKTGNNGQNWTPLTDNLPITRISDIALNPQNPDEIYISLCDYEYIGFGLNLNGRKRNTHYGVGVYKTLDGGLTWNPTGLSFQLASGDASLIRKIIVHPTNPDDVVACGSTGMYKSSNSGNVWVNVMDSLFWDMVQDPSDPDVLYAATGWVKNSNDGSSAIYKSTDFGSTWTLLNTGIPFTGSVQRIRLGIAPSNSNYIYALAVNDQSGFYGFYKSVNAGSTWQFLPPLLNVLESNEGFSQGGQGTYDLALYIDANDPDKVFTGGVNIWGSNDGAVSFNPVTHWTSSYGPSIHADVHSIDRQASTGNIFVSCDGGIYRTGNMVIHSWADAQNGIPWPTLWTKLNDNRQVTSFYRISSSRNNDGALVAGAQDNATFFYNQANGWSTIFGGDGMDNYIDPANSDVVIGSSQYGNFTYSDDGGFSGFGLFPNINGEVAEWTTPLIADYNISGLLYTGFENVVKSPDNGNTWTSISSFPSGFDKNEISALAVANTNGAVLYAARRVRYEFNIPGSVFRTLNNGVTWTDVTAGLPDSLYYTSVDINDAYSNTAYVAMAGFSVGNKVFMTSNNGSSWQNISYNLPNLPVNCVKSLPGGQKLLAATDVGIYVLDSGSVNWIMISNGLPNVIVTDIEFNVALNKLYISTFGRGVWETDLNSVLAAGIKSPTAAMYNIDLYPSLNNGAFTLKLNHAGSNEKARLNIFDIMGRNVYSGSVHNGVNALHVNVPPGKYFVKITGSRLSAVRSFIVE
jgi:hypothetical protein